MAFAYHDRVGEMIRFGRQIVMMSHVDRSSVGVWGCRGCDQIEEMYQASVVVAKVISQNDGISRTDGLMYFEHETKSPFSFFTTSTAKIGPALGNFKVV